MILIEPENQTLAFWIAYYAWLFFCHLFGALLVNFVLALRHRRHMRRLYDQTK